MWKRIRWEHCPCLEWAMFKRNERSSLRSCWWCTRKIEQSRWSAIQWMNSRSGDDFWKSGSWWTEVDIERCWCNYCNVLSREAEVKPGRSGNVLHGSTRRRIWTRSRTQSKQQYWHTTHRFRVVWICQTERDRVAGVWCFQKCVERERKKQG